VLLFDIVNYSFSVVNKYVRVTYVLLAIIWGLANLRHS